MEEAGAKKSLPRVIVGQWIVSACGANEINSNGN